MSDPNEFFQSFDGLAVDDLALLESLVQSPVFSALKRALNKYREACLAELLSSSDTHKIYQTQGRIIGLKVIENLPGILVQRKKLAEKKVAEAHEVTKELQQRRDRIFDPKLPPIVKKRPTRP